MDLEDKVKKPHQLRLFSLKQEYEMYLESGKARPEEIIAYKDFGYISLSFRENYFGIKRRWYEHE